MSALVLNAQMSRLMRQHDQTLVTPELVPLAPAVDHPQILEGRASTLDLDCEKIKFAPFAFGALSSGYPPLLHEHDHSLIAGHIERLEYNAEGELLIAAYVTLDQARRCGGFSVGAKVVRFELCDVESPDFYALILKAVLTDVSLTSRPVNRHATVLHRSRPSPASAFRAEKAHWHDLMIKRVELVRQLAGHLQHAIHKEAQT